MSKRSLVLAVLALSGLAASAKADPLTITGIVEMEQTTTVACEVELKGERWGWNNNYVTITSGKFEPGSMGSWQCGLLVTPANFPWHVTINPGNEVVVTGLAVNSIIGTCAGSFTTTGLSSSSLLISAWPHSAWIPGSPQSCRFLGVLYF